MEANITKRKRSLTPEENKAINSQRPARNRSMIAARRLKGSVIVYDPVYKI